MVDPRSLIDMLMAADNSGEPVPPVNRRETILGVVITFMLLSWICASLRIYVRLFVVRTPGWDDVFLVAYLLSTTLGSIMICTMTDWGLGQHFLALSLDKMEGYLLRFYIANASYCMSTTFIKLSLLFQYLRIFEDVRMRRICTVLIVLVSMWGMSYSFLAWVPCNPPRAAWNFSLLQSSKCWAFDSSDPVVFAASYTSHSAINMTFDLIVFAIPIPLYFRKNITTRTRMGLLALLSMGAIVVFISVWRLAGIIEHRAATYPTFDPTFYVPVSMVLSAVEVDVASMCASAPVFWPVLREQVMKVLITQEIEIIREERSDEFEMRHTWTGQSGQNERRSTGSRQGSEVGLQDYAPEAEKARGTQNHYNDQYIQYQVNPFAERRGVESRVEAGSGSAISKNKKG